MDVIIFEKSFVVGTMEGRMTLLLLFVLGAAWACDARDLAIRDHFSSNTANFFSLIPLFSFFAFYYPS